MPDVTIDEALAEAYASAPADRPVINTLSIWFDGMVDENGSGTEIYLFQGFDGDRRSPEGVPLRDLVLEPGARFHGGEVVGFVGLPFEIVLPDVSTQQLARGQLRVDGVGREISRELTKAIELSTPIEVTYRPYIEGLEAEGPQAKPIRFGLANVSATATLVSGDIVLRHVSDRKFPREVYDIERFPALVR